MLDEKDDIVGKKIILNGRKLAVVKHDKIKNMFELLVLKNKFKEEIDEGQRLRLTESYLEEIGFDIVKE